MRSQNEKKLKRDTLRKVSLAVYQNTYCWKRSSLAFDKVWILERRNHSIKWKAFAVWLCYHRNQCDHMLSNSFCKRCYKSSHISFYFKSDFQNSRKITKICVTFKKVFKQVLLKIALPIRLHWSQPITCISKMMGSNLAIVQCHRGLSR